MAVCEKYQISHSHYLGGAPVWTDEDRAKAEAWVEYVKGYCPTCGTRAEWWDPARGGHRFAMVGETHRCSGCELMEQEREQIPSKAKGIHVYLKPNPRLTEEAHRG